MNKLIILFLLLPVLFFSSCGSSSIVVNDPGASIYVNGINKGKGEVSIRRTGFPKRVSLSVKSNGVTIGSKEVSRKFTAVTFLTGCITYGICFFTCWQFPETIFVPTDIPGNNSNHGNSWDNKHASPWDKPIKK